MPIIDFTLVEGQLSPPQKAELAEQLTRCLLKCDVTRDNPKAPAINWCYIHELPDAHVYVAGAPQKKPHYRIEISIMQGAMSEAVKRQVVADMTEVTLAIEGTENESAECITGVDTFPRNRRWQLGRCRATLSAG